MAGRIPIEDQPRARADSGATGRTRARANSASGESLYALLGLQKGASDEDIKKAYRRLALKYHPDKNQGNPEAEEMFKEINNANSILKDPNKKRIYDQYGSVGLKLAEQIGEENVALYMCMDSKATKCCCLCAFLATCCCFGCFCCCCCCLCCCGLCAPSRPEEDYGDVRPEDLYDEEEPVTAQPRKPDYQSVGETTPPPEDRNEIDGDKAPIS